MKTLKKAMSAVLCLVMLLAAVPVGNIGMTASAISRSAFDAKLAEVQAMYPQGSQRTSWPKGSTCHGYARWISEYVWGSDFANGRGTGWTQIKASSSYSYVDSIRPGDVIRFRRAGKTWNHTIFITDVSESTLIYTDCNSDGNSTIKWNQTMSKSAMDTALKLALYDSSNETATYGYIAQYQDVVENTSAPDTSHNPIGSADWCLGGIGYISIGGWAFDPDDINTQLNIHVYIGEGDSTEAIGWISAGGERTDVDALYGCGAYHGFGLIIDTRLTGEQRVQIYAINVGNGNNVLLKDTTVTILDPNPYGDLNSIDGGEGSVHVRGWVFDADNYDVALEIHVYIGDLGFNGIYADKKRTDVDQLYHVGEYHGFDQTIETSRTGSQTVSVYAINIGRGENVFLGSKTVYISPHTHSYTPQVTTPATCTADGVRTYTCSCGDSYTESIPINSSNHVNKINVAATNSTCTVKGYTAGVYCNDCKKYISGHAEKPLADHTITVINKKDATYDAAGYTGDEYCTVCKQTIKSGTVIPKLEKTDEPTQPGAQNQPQKVGGCPWCGGSHNGFIGSIIGFFHRIFAAIFGARY